MVQVGFSTKPVQVRFGNQTIQVRVEGAALVSRQAALAQDAADVAQAAADYAEAFSGTVYNTQAAGQAATEVGKVFRVNAGGGVLAPYLRTTSGSTALQPLATTAALASPEPGKGAEMVAGAYKVLRVTDAGVSPGASASLNLARFQEVIDAASAGDVVSYPRTGSAPAVIDTSGGWQSAIQIDKPLHLIVDGDLQASDSSIGVNPPFIFNVTAPGVVITGNGRLIGDGAIDDSNAGSAETTPGLIRVAADNFTIDGLEMISAPKCAIMLYQCNRARIVGTKFAGGPTEYGGDSATGYFGIYTAGGGSHTFEDLRFYPDADGGMFVQCIFYNSSSDNTVINCRAKHPYEKLIYASGTSDRNRDIACRVVGNPGTIPGTNFQGTITDVVRYEGSDNKSVDLLATDVAAAIQFRSGAGGEVHGLKALRCGQSGVTIHQSALTGVKIRGSTVTKGALAGLNAGDGLRLVANAGTSDVEVSGNRVRGFSVTDQIANIPTWQASTSYPNVAVVKPSSGNGRYYKKHGGGPNTSGGTEPAWPTTPGATVTDNGIVWTCVAYEGGQAEIRVIGQGSGAAAIVDSLISGNIVGGGQYGIRTQYLEHSKVAFNKAHVTEWGFTEDSGASNQWEFNKTRGTPNVGVQNMGVSSSSTSPQTFTPVLSDGTNNATMGGASANQCAYSRAGDLVTITGNVATTALGSVSGSVRITGLPYAARSGAAGNAAISVGYAGGMAIAAGQNVIGRLEGGTDYIQLYLYDAATGATELQASEWTASGNLAFSLAYYAA